MQIDIKPHIKTAWQMVGLDYNAGLINSERCMQASLYRGLRTVLPPNFRVFVEPDWKTTEPDMVIEKDDRIVAVLELKFVPHAYAQYEGDLEKLTLKYVSSNEYCPVHIVPEAGNWEHTIKKTLPATKIDDNVIRVFAAICRHDGEALDPTKFAGLGVLNLWGKVSGRIEGKDTVFGTG